MNSNLQIQLIPPYTYVLLSPLLFLLLDSIFRWLSLCRLLLWSRSLSSFSSSIMPLSEFCLPESLNSILTTLGFASNLCMCKALILSTIRWASGRLSVSLIKLLFLFWFITLLRYGLSFWESEYSQDFKVFKSEICSTTILKLEGKYSSNRSSRSGMSSANQELSFRIQREEIRFENARNLNIETDHWLMYLYFWGNGLTELQFRINILRLWFFSFTRGMLTSSVIYIHANLGLVYFYLLN